VDAHKEPIAVALDGEEIILGSDPQCDLVLQHDAYVSRRHARITRDGDFVFIDDLSSSNGTFLRVRRSIALEPGDELLMGTTVLRLEHRGV